MTELEKKAEEYAKSIFSTNDKDSAYYQQLMFTAYKDGYEQGQESMMFEFAIKDRQELIKENEELKKELEKWKEEHHKQVLLANDEGWNRTQLQIKNNKLNEQIKKMKQYCIDIMKVQANNLTDNYMAGMYNGMVVVYNSCFIDEKNELEMDFCSKNNNKWELEK